jgi:KRAB domain-containing zinc finger protein
MGKNDQTDNHKEDNRKKYNHILENIQGQLQLQEQKQKELQVQLQDKLSKQQDEHLDKVLHEISKRSQPLEKIQDQLQHQEEQQKELQIQLQNQLIKQQDQTSDKILQEIMKIAQPHPPLLKSPFSIIDTLDLDVEKKAQIAMFIANSSSGNKNEDETQ